MSLPHRGTQHYMAEKGYYVQPADSGSSVVVEKEKPVWTPCLWVLVALFVIFVIALTIVLIIVLTIGNTSIVVRA